MIATRRATLTPTLVQNIGQASRDVPIRAALSRECAQVLAEFLERGTAKKQIDDLDLEDDEARLQTRARLSHSAQAAREMLREVAPLL